MSIRNELLEEILTATEGSITPEQVAAIDSYINTDYIRMLNTSPQIIGTTTQTIDMGDVSSNYGITYNDTDDSIDIATTRLYSLNVTVNGKSSANNELYLWFESFNGVSWDILTTSGLDLTFANNQIRQATITSTLPYPAGLRLRLRGRATSGTITLTTSFTEGATTITTAGIAISIVAEAP